MRRPIDVLQAMKPPELAQLLRARPGLLRPRPNALADVANRAFQHPAVIEATHGLDGLHLAVLDALALVAGDAQPSELAALIGVTTGEVEPAVADLAALLLVDDHDGRVHLFPGVRNTLGSPGGLGPPIRDGLQRTMAPVLLAIAANLGVPSNRRVAHTAIDGIAERLSTAAGVQAAVEDLPPVAQEWFAERAAAPEHRFAVRGGVEWYGGPPRTALEWVMSRGLMVPFDWGSVAIPREIGMRVRGDHPLGMLGIRPSVPHAPVDPDVLASTAATSAQSAITLVASFLEECDERPLAVLKSGGVGIREIRRVAKRLEVADPVATRVVELAFAAGLIGYVHTADLVAPSEAADDWARKPPADRWVELASAWLATSRHPGLAGTEGDDGKPIPALMGHGGASGAIIRRDALAVLAGLPAGHGAPTHAVGALVWWRAPRRYSSVAVRTIDLVVWALEEAATLGVVADGALTPCGRALLAGDVDGARSQVAGLLPPPIETFTIQADLTAVVPGALEPASHTILADLADVESAGVASVWRFTEASVRRAFDLGRTAEELTSFLEAHATHGVPQTLGYLISDVARRHGHLRVTGALTVVHGLDEALLAEVVRHRRLARQALRLVAPTVAVTTKKPGDVITALRAAGYLPVSETADGTVTVERPERRRADATVTNFAVGARRTTPEPVPAAEVDALADRLLRTAPAKPAPTKAANQPQLILLPEEEDVLDLLEEACDLDAPVMLGYRDPAGMLQEVVAYPQDFGEFVLDAVTDRGRQSFLLERIEWARPVIIDD